MEDNLENDKGMHTVGDATAAELADEVIRNNAAWNLAQFAPRWRSILYWWSPPTMVAPPTTDALQRRSTPSLVHEYPLSTLRRTTVTMTSAFRWRRPWCGGWLEWRQVLSAVSEDPFVHDGRQGRSTPFSMPLGSGPSRPSREKAKSGAQPRSETSAVQPGRYPSSGS